MDHYMRFRIQKTENRAAFESRFATPSLNYPFELRSRDLSNDPIYPFILKQV